MAYGDLSLFRQSSGDDPNRDVMMAEARQKADYLSSMDQFYEQLEATQEMFAQEMAWEKERLGLEQEWLTSERIGSQEFQHEEHLLDIEESGRQFDITAAQHAEEQEWLRDYTGAQFEFESGLAAATFEEEYGTNELLAYRAAHGPLTTHEFSMLMAGQFDSPTGVTYNPDTNRFY